MAMSFGQGKQLNEGRAARAAPSCRVGQSAVDRDPKLAEQFHANPHVILALSLGHNLPQLPAKGFITNGSLAGNAGGTGCP